MNWYDSERNIHEHVLRAEKLARHYPNIAYLVERESGRRRINHALVTLGALLVTWGNHLQQRWAVEIPACSGTPMVTNNN